MSTDKTGQSARSAHTVTCEYCNMRGHRTEDCKRKQAGYRPMRSDIICFKCGKQGHRQFYCPNANEKGAQKTAAMQVINQNTFHDEQPMWSGGRPHNCDESLGDVEVKLACGCMYRCTVVAEAVSHEGERTLKCICAGMTPCSVGNVNSHKVEVMRDTGSTTCVVKQSLVEPEQMTGNHKLCVLIDGVVTRFPTAIVKTNMPYYEGTVKALRIENPVQELIVGNVLGATGVEACYEVEVTVTY